MFDQIALKELGSEYLFPLLLEANPKHRTTLKFSAGVVLNIPEVSKTTHYENLPEWLEDNEEINEFPEEIEVLHGVDA